MSLYDRTSEQHLDYLEQHKAASARTRRCVHDEPVPGCCGDCKREYDEATR